jgi:hypothetical protein
MCARGSQALSVSIDLSSGRYSLTISSDVPAAPSRAAGWAQLRKAPPATQQEGAAPRP